MRGKAYGKVNWTLAVGGLRPDGYHEIDSVMQKIELADTVALTETNLGMAVRTSGSMKEGVPTDESNLAWKAAETYRQAAGLNQSWEILIEKEIPHGAGLGGGSADAATVLRLLNERYGELKEKRLYELAADLGADVPFLLSTHKAARCEGVGERMTPVNVADAFPMLLAMGSQRVSTGRAYAGVESTGGINAEKKKGDTERMCRKLAAGETVGIGKLLFNDLTAPACALAPEINRLLEDLRRCSPITAGMTGSGAACFALFQTDRQAQEAALALRGRWPFIWTGSTLARG